MQLSFSPNTLEIRLNERLVGTLTRLVDDTIVFAFDPSYENDENRPILSMSHKGSLGALIPGRTRTGPRLSPFFSNLLPEGHLRDYLARKLSINTAREFFLLGALGLDLPGAVIATPLGELSGLDQRDLDASTSEEPRRLRFSLAGMQLKFSAIVETKGTFTVPADGAGGSWIVKLPSERHLQVPETEYSMLSLAGMVGIEVPDFKLIPTKVIEGLPEDFKNIVADSLAVKRFDRTVSGGRVHMEDFAQVYGVYPQEKYEKAGYAHIGRVLWAEAGEESYCEFVRRLVFTIATGNGDMHLKNWSLLYRNPQKPVLSPAYDFVPTISYIEKDLLALNLGGTKNFLDVTLEKFKKMAVSSKAPEKLTVRVVEESIERISTEWAKNKFDLLLPRDIRHDIDSHMAKQPLFKRTPGVVAASRTSSYLKNLTIAAIEFDPIIDEHTICLEAPTGRTTAVRAPERMEPELILEAAQQGLLSELGQGPIRVLVGEKLYREWRRLNFITVDDEPIITSYPDRSWRGKVQSIESKFSAQSWQKIVSAHQRESMEEIDILQRDGSIRNIKARIQKISDIHREDGSSVTKAFVEFLIEDEKELLNPHDGV